MTISNLFNLLPMTIAPLSAAHPPHYTSPPQRLPDPAFSPMVIPPARGHNLPKRDNIMTPLRHAFAAYLAAQDALARAPADPRRRSALDRARDAYASAYASAAPPDPPRPNPDPYPYAAPKRRARATQATPAREALGQARPAAPSPETPE